MSNVNDGRSLAGLLTASPLFSGSNRSILCLAEQSSFPKRGPACACGGAIVNKQSETQNTPRVRHANSISRWGGLRTKIIAWAFVPTAIILLAVALVTFTAYQRVAEDLAIERDQELIRLSASQLAAELAKYADILGTLGRTTGTYGHPAVQRITLQRASERLAIFDGGVLILDTFGKVVATEPERPEALDRIGPIAPTSIRCCIFESRSSQTSWPTGRMVHMSSSSLCLSSVPRMSF
jgi:hypothetical protein